MNLVEGLTTEIVRVTEILRVYKEVPGIAGFLAAMIMEKSLEKAMKAQAYGDVVEMLASFNELKEYEL